MKCGAMALMLAAAVGLTGCKSGGGMFAQGTNVNVESPYGKLAVDDRNLQVQTPNTNIQVAKGAAGSTTSPNAPVQQPSTGPAASGQGQYPSLNPAGATTTAKPASVNVQTPAGSLQGSMTPRTGGY